MTNIDTPDGQGTVPREYLTDKVQIMGSPDQDWSLHFDPKVIVTLLRTHMSNVQVSEPQVIFGETVTDIAYTFPPGWAVHESFGSLRTDPNGGLSFDALSYGLVFDLLETLLQTYPSNKDIVVIFGEFRALFHRAGMPRNEGIHRLQNALHVELTKILFPHN